MVVAISYSLRENGNLAILKTGLRNFTIMQMEFAVLPL
jgi:hypothetical protein